MQIVSVKKAEDGDEAVVRFRELAGQPAAGIRLTSGFPLAGAREIDGQEMPVGSASLQDGALGFDLTPYGLRAFALKMGPPPRRPAARATSRPLAASPVPGRFKDSVTLRLQPPL